MEMIQQLLQNQVFVGIGGASVMAAAMWFMRTLPGRLYTYFLAWFTVTVETKSEDASFHWIQKWLAAHPYSKTARRLRLSSADGYSDGIPVSANETRAEGGPKFLLSPGNGWHLLFYRGRPVVLSRESEGGQQGRVKIETMTMRMAGRSRDVLNALIEEAWAYSHESSRDRLMIYQYAYQGWHESVRAARREFESVVLADGLAESIAQDAEKFLASEAWYAKRGVPWRRGYLFSGPPGTGKSSFVAALASRLQCGVYPINLSAIASDDDLLHAMRSQKERSILLVEDVDAGFVKREGGDQKQITFSAFLNAIDGISAPTGRILIMTTNHPEKLDPALIRPGRIDLQVKLDLATAEQAARIFLRFFPNHANESRAFGAQMAGEAPARIQEVLLACGDNPARALVRKAA